MGFNSKNIKSRIVWKKSKTNRTNRSLTMGVRKCRFSSISINTREEREKITENEEDNQRKREDNRTENQRKIDRKCDRII